MTTSYNSVVTIHKGSLAGLVDKPPTLMLAADEDIVGQGLGILDAFIVTQHLLQEGKDAAHPKRVTAVDKLICASLKATFEPHLPHDGPTLCKRKEYA